MTNNLWRLKGWVSRFSGHAQFHEWRRKKEADIAEKVWSGEHVLDMEQTQAELAGWIRSGVPFTAGKIGANEQNLLHWALHVPIPTPIFGRRFFKFYKLSYCESTAGLKPRTPESYKAYAVLLKNAVACSDLLGIWHSRPGEKGLIQACGAKPIYTGLFSLGPFFADMPWTAALEGKRVFVVSPFLDTIKSQMLKNKSIWPDRSVLPPMQLEGYKFPYLVSRGVKLSWHKVYDDVVNALKTSDFEVALFGCGALGLPLAAKAKELGRQGIHLGGLLQEIFGIRSRQFDLDPSFAKFITAAWVRPSAEETPPEAPQIEDGRYW